MKPFYFCLFACLCHANHGTVFWFKFSPSRPFVVYPYLTRVERVHLLKKEQIWHKSQHRRKRGFVIGGTAVLSDEEFPEYVSIWADQGDKAPSCGGFIIDKYHIMTAANCGKSTKWAVAGTRWRLNKDKKPFNRLTSCSNAPGAASTSMGIWYKDYRICKLEMPLTFSK